MSEKQHGVPRRLGQLKPLTWAEGVISKSCDRPLRWAPHSDGTLLIPLPLLLLMCAHAHILSFSVPQINKIFFKKKSKAVKPRQET